MGLKQSKDEPTKIDMQMTQAMTERAQSGHFTIKSFNSIIMKFPKIDESFGEVRSVFKKFELQVDFSQEEIQAFYKECDMDSSNVIEFKEFIVVLALVYLLGTPASQSSTGKTNKSRIGLAQLESTFDTIVEAFVFFDRDHDGFITKDEFVGAINEAAPGKEGAEIGVQRFEEMKWNKEGRITFKEFLFAFTDWVGLEDEIEEG
ncbi:hypothetical protein KC19_11G147500 [Ceratodon purpureus]|uniref:EF-hand domain-containing protein n=1 Tax=Ceratodon purpureus TaxID=3225 RepID=A0A8T0GEI2_CERPU|nr:hypothetical protein KC19_11G147500 [Ceratodon purpureus]